MVRGWALGAAVVYAGLNGNACAASAAPGVPAAQHCPHGPLLQSFGGASWLMYGCDDAATLLIVTAPGNPAAPYAFVVRPTDAGVEVHARNGRSGRAAPAGAEAAARDIERLTSDEVRAVNVLLQTK